MDPGDTFSAQSRNEPAAHLTISRTGTRYSSSLADVWVPLLGHVIVFLLQPLIAPVTSPCSNPPSLLIPIDTGNESCPHFLLLKPPGTLYLPTSFPLSPGRQAARNRALDLTVVAGDFFKFR
jgi:hypothetical protein